MVASQCFFINNGFVSQFLVGHGFFHAWQLKKCVFILVAIEPCLPEELDQIFCHSANMNNKKNTLLESQLPARRK